MDLSVVIIALNEELNLQRCLNSLPKDVEIVVLDSGSKDRTQEIARNLGANVFERPFDNYGNQKNYALSLATRGWILVLDADEELSPEFCLELKKIVFEKRLEAYKIRRQLIFMGQKMRFGKTRDFPLRLFPKGLGRFVGSIHEKLQLDPQLAVKTSISRPSILHYSYKNLEDYFLKFNRYTSAIAKGHFQNKKSAPSRLSLGLRPWFEFFGRYILRGGILDGYPGYVYALLSSFYAFVKYEKLRILYEEKE